MKLVSVIIPVYKVEKYIRSALQSGLEQTYQNIEILIIDDGSPDRSIEICKEFIDNRIKIISQENQGLAAARNTGIRHARGEYLTFLDGDDLWLPEKLEKHVEHLENSPNVGISFSRSAFINEDGDFLNTYQMPQLKDIKTSTLLYYNPVGNGSAGVFRREVFEAIEFKVTHDNTIKYCYFDTDFIMLQDIECWLRIAIKTSWELEGIPEALTLYRVNPSGLSGNLLKAIYYWEMLDKKTSVYAPDLIARSQNLAMAYRFRNLAREAVRRHAGSIAVEVINRALASNWRIIFIEPLKTILTLIMSYLVWLMPKSLYFGVEHFILTVKGFIQKRRILREEFGN